MNGDIEMSPAEEDLRDALKDEAAFDDEKEAARYGRERLIALLSWWSGWCTDHDHIEPELAKLGGLLLDAKHRIALDRSQTPLNASSDGS